MGVLFRSSLFKIYLSSFYCNIETINLCYFFQIMPGTNSHNVIRLSKKGMKRVNQLGYGDHYVHIKIQVCNLIDFIIILFESDLS